MKVGVLSAAAAMALAIAGASRARMPGTPAAMPGGTTGAVPAGANPFPGLHFPSRTAFFFGNIYDATGTKLPVSLDVNATELNVNLLHDTVAKRDAGGTRLQPDLSTPLTF